MSQASKSIYDFEGPECPPKTCELWTFPEEIDLDPNSNECDGVAGDEDGNNDEEEEDDQDGIYDQDGVDDEEVAEDADGADRDGDQEMEDTAEEDGGYQLRGNRNAKGLRGQQSKKGGELIGGSRTGNRTERVHCAGQVGYWGGVIELIQGYWLGFKVSVWLIWINKWQYAVSIIHFYLRRQMVLTNR